MKLTTITEMPMRRAAAALGIAGGTILVGATAWALVQWGPLMGGVQSMLGTAAIIAGIGAVIAALSLLGVRSVRPVWIVQAIAGFILTLLATGQYHSSAVSWVLLAVGIAWLAAAGFGFASRKRPRRA